MKQIPTIRYRRDLFRLFTSPGEAVEIGVAEGNFSLDMLKWNIGDGESAPVRAALKRLYLVDRWKSVPEQKGDASMPQEWHETNLKQVRQKIKPFADRAVILRGDSVSEADEVEDGTLTLVYVDGDHSYEGCFADCRAWAPKVKPGGFMAFHDYLNENYGVGQAVRDFCGKNFKIHVLEEDKPEDAGCFFQIC